MTLLRSLHVQAGIASPPDEDWVASSVEAQAEAARKLAIDAVVAPPMLTSPPNRYSALTRCSTIDTAVISHVRADPLDPANIGCVETAGYL